jgi:leader peptidase (prepilin peptidase) / N-methyltransferase
VGLAAVASLILLFQLLIVCWIDMRHLMIPNWLNLSLAVTGLTVSTQLLGVPFYLAFIQGVVVFGVFWLLSYGYFQLRGRQGLGGGDVKFIAAASFWVGIVGLPWTILIASISGLALVVILHLMGHGTAANQRLAFGPHLALGLFGTWMFRDTFFVIGN